MTGTGSARSRRGLQAALVLVGSVALGTGSTVMVRGTAAIPGGAPTVASNDSVLRFYAVWWAAQGPVFCSAARRVPTCDGSLLVSCALTFVGGLARLAAARSSGPPHLLFRVLTGFELVAPPLLLAWEHRLRTAAD